MTSSYKERLSLAMDFAVNSHQYLIIGQGSVDGGHGMSATIDASLHENCIEMPVFEETQTGVALGLALDGHNTISIYPRFDFFISGLSQLVNHADKIGIMSGEKFSPNIIFRVGVGAKVPLDAGPQHTNNYSAPLEAMLTEIKVHELTSKKDPLEVYKAAITQGGVHLIIEHYEFYGEKLCGS